MKRYTILLAMSLSLASLIMAGCIGSPAPAPTPAATATPSPTAPAPSPTLIGKSDEAHIQFNYKLGTASTEFSGLQKAAPGNLLYLVQVNVSSDKPVQTSIDWFWMEYKANASDSVHTSNSAISFVTYPTKVIGGDNGSARGELIFELPASMAPGYPKPYYYMPLEDQQGQYKVYDKVYGTVGDVQ